jgi:hypothetical protein
VTVTPCAPSPTRPVRLLQPMVLFMGFCDRSLQAFLWRVLGSLGEPLRSVFTDRTDDRQLGSPTDPGF